MELTCSKGEAIGNETNQLYQIKRQALVQWLEESYKANLSVQKLRKKVLYKCRTYVYKLFQNVIFHSVICRVRQDAAQLYFI